ncbi:MAG: CopG family transcriptional regulator [Sulfurovum sp.]|nr:MAG: CopG family transcriptional regulator [Sulfurovum sp.]
MTATVRLDDTLEKTLDTLSKQLHKKKSDVIRDAITFYATNLEKNKKDKLRLAIEKTKAADKCLNGEIEDTLNDGI